MLYALALVDAILWEASSGLCVLAVRSRQPSTTVACIVAAAILAAACAPVFFVMSKVAQGSLLIPVSAAAIATAGCSVALAWACDDQQSRRQWIGFGLIALGALVRATADK